MDSGKHNANERNHQQNHIQQAEAHPGQIVIQAVYRKCREEQEAKIQQCEPRPQYVVERIFK